MGWGTCKNSTCKPLVNIMKGKSSTQYLKSVTAKSQRVSIQYLPQLLTAEKRSCKQRVDAPGHPSAEKKRGRGWGGREMCINRPLTTYSDLKAQPRGLEGAKSNGQGFGEGLWRSATLVQQVAPAISFSQKKQIPHGGKWSRCGHNRFMVSFNCVKKAKN